MSDCAETHDSTRLLLDEYNEKSGTISRHRDGWNLLAKIYVLLTTFATILSISVILLSSKEKLVFGGEVNNITPAFSMELHSFSPALDYYTLNYTSAEQSKIVRQRWQDLLPKGGGNVHIPDFKSYSKLSEPFINAKGLELWKVSWAHQIHCLYYIMNAYDEVVRLGPTGKEGLVEEGHHTVHTSHCFDYLRQAIMCNGDMTLEGRTVLDNTKGTDGFGHTHVCRNHDQVVQWAEKYAGPDEEAMIVQHKPTDA